MAVVRIGAGPQVLEAALLAELSARSPLEPLRVVVPSGALRLHLGRRLVASGGPRLGIQVQTLHKLAEELLERSGERLPGGGALFDVVVRRVAAEEAELGALAMLEDGYAAVASSVRELLDAGLSAFDADPIGESLDEALLQGRIRAPHHARAHAVLRVALGCLAEMEEQGVARPSAVLRRAAELFEQDPELLPQRVILYGFVEEHGVAVALLSALLRAPKNSIYLDYPPDPRDPELSDASHELAQTLLERLAVPGQVTRLPGKMPLPALVLGKAPGMSAEARDVAFRIRQLLDQGVVPEEIAVVARNLRPYVSPLRVQLRRMGVPWSGVEEAGPPDASVRRGKALLDLLHHRDQTPVDRWLACLGSLPAAPGPGILFSRRVKPQRHDLRVALRVVGASTLAEIAAISVDVVTRDGFLPLPVRRGMTHGEQPPEGELFSEEEEDEEQQSAQPDGNSKVPRRYFGKDRLSRVVDAAALAATRLLRWQQAADRELGAGLPLRGHLEQLRLLIDEDLGWLPEIAGVPHLQDALRKLGRGIPSGLELSLDEFVLLVGRCLKELPGHALGGEGGGVQLLSATEARGRSFSHLFLVGMNRDVFPASKSEDPLLPDPVRAALAPMLPSLPRRGAAFMFERYLFTTLLAGAPQAMLTWQGSDDDGKEKSASPLVDRLRTHRKIEVLNLPPVIPGVAPTQIDERLRLRPPLEHAMLAAVHSSRKHLENVLALALGAGAGRQPVIVAAARRVVLDELDPDRRLAEGWARYASSGPYLGFVGAVVHPGDPRNDAPHLTVVENLAACGWQVLLQRVLRLEDVPDPTLSLPAFERSLVGTVVHRSLERIARDAFAAAGVKSPRSMATATTAVPVRWPAADTLYQLVLAEAEETIRNRGIGIQGFAAVLARQAMDPLEVVRNRDWSGGPVDMLGVELPGELALVDHQGKPRTIPFVADRLDASGKVTEYKTGRPISDAVKEQTRHKHLAGKVARGERLQAIAYALARGKPEAEGRFFFVGPSIETELREYPVAAADSSMAASLDRVLRATLEAWDRGSLLPRLVEPNKNVEPSRCRFCEVSAACSRRDSGLRGRMQKMVEQWSEVPTASGVERAWLALWRLRLGAVTEEGA